MCRRKRGSAERFNAHWIKSVELNRSSAMEIVSICRGGVSLEMLQRAVRSNSRLKATWRASAGGQQKERTTLRGGE